MIQIKIESAPDELDGRAEGGEETVGYGKKDRFDESGRRQSAI